MESVGWWKRYAGHSRSASAVPAVAVAPAKRSSAVGARTAAALSATTVQLEKTCKALRKRMVKPARAAKSAVMAIGLEVLPLWLESARTQNVIFRIIGAREQSCCWREDGEHG